MAVAALTEEGHDGQIYEVTGPRLLSFREAVEEIAAATGKNLRQIEELVADHRLGDRPDDPPDPEARTHVVRFELAAETFALLRQARTMLNDEHGFWNNAALLMFVKGQLATPATVKVTPFGNWKVGTGLPAVDGETNTFRAESWFPVK